MLAHLSGASAQERPARADFGRAMHCVLAGVGAETGAHNGFVKFKIQQKLNNPNGTKIYNSAGIYFDYNAPIITNRTFHTIGQNFVTVQLINTIKNSKYNVKEVKVFPNPATEHIFISGLLDTSKVEIFSVSGAKE